MSARKRGTILGVALDELDLAATLNSGQAFRWNVGPDGVWRGAVGRSFLALSQDRSAHTIQWETDDPGGESAVRSFLRLDDIGLDDQAKLWSAGDAFFGDAWALRPGVRILRQDPTECFFSFLCASVAPIRRISAMLDSVAREAGTPLGDGVISFPGPDALASVSETRLRELGLGFRAARVASSARELAGDSSGALGALRGASETEIRERLTAFSGVGTKIADCIALFSLDRDDAVPIDTHLWRLATNRYAPHLAGMSLTPARYVDAVSCYREEFGPRAGWAQQILFYRVAVEESAQNAPVRAAGRLRETK